MSDSSTIEWTDATWNPIAGCSIVSPGCTNCYAMRRVAPRLAANPATPHYAGTIQPSKAGPVWTGRIGIASDAVLLKPLGWRKPRMIFVNSTSDLFHPDVPDAVIDRIFAVMALCPQHIFQVLTKRPERMRDYLGELRDGRRVYELACDMTIEHQLPVILITHPSHERHAPPGPRIHLGIWPFPNVWLGTSVEDQQRADERIPHLLQTPAAVRFISAEPLLGPIDLSPHLLEQGAAGNCIDIDGQWWHPPGSCRLCVPRLDWVIVGGESGSGARPMHPDWARALRDQCAAAGVPFFFKQWGSWGDFTDAEPMPTAIEERIFTPSGKVIGAGVDYGRHGMVDKDWRAQSGAWMLRLSKHAAGRLLDGIEHNGMPK